MSAPWVTREPSSRLGAQRSRRSAWLVACLCLVPIALLRATTLAESDTFWQIRTGQLILRSHRIPLTDPFSWTAFGEPWTVNSWGFDVLLAAAHHLGGLPGVALTGSVLAMLSCASVLDLSRRWGASPQVSAPLLFLVLSLVIGWMSVRPQLVDYSMAIWLIGMLHTMERRTSAAPMLLAVAGLFVVWVNLHAASLLGVVLCLAAGTALATSPHHRRQGLYCFAAAAVALGASLVNPRGWGLFTQTLGVQRESSNVVSEWLPLDFSNPQQVGILALGLVALVLAARRRLLLPVGVLLSCLAGSVVAVRLLPLLALVAVPVLAAGLSTPEVHRYLRTRRLVLVPGAAAGVLAVAVMFASSATHIGRPDPDRYSAAVVAQVPTGCRLFNSYLLGGAVILQRPDVPVSMDSRNDLYGADRVLANTRTVELGHTEDGSLDAADCVLVPSTSALARTLEADPRWDRRARDRAAALLVRR